MKTPAIDPDEKLHRSLRENWVNRHPDLAKAKELAERARGAAREVAFHESPAEYVEAIKRAQRVAAEADAHEETVKKALIKQYNDALGID